MFISIPSSLEMKLRMYCDPGYYGPDCNCQPKNSSSLGHYTCDRISGKVCLPGMCMLQKNSTIVGILICIILYV
jgi:hypothetical protein